MEMLKVALFDGAQPNNTVKVKSGGSLQADVSGSSVDATIGPATADVETTRSTLGTTSAEIADTDPDRTQILLQNLDGVNSIHVRFDGTSATIDDMRLSPGGTFSFPVGVVYTGKINAVATDVDTKYVLIVYRRN